ncbi:hypothetical protein CW705_04615 [Candidatus Bathyarchaeota archaeon]|nr:MAG: hypothetical protein CW705_04615 [Candidatus Bathyarchaeota archaeon]
MRSKIAVATVSGRAYYWLVNELNKRRIPFLSLIPGENIPPSIKVVITTKDEKERIDHPYVLIYDPEEKPSIIIDEALRIIKNKKVYEEVVVGVDPGKTFGVAVLGDGEILEKKEQLSLEMAIDLILTTINRHPARTYRIKIGDGVPELAEEIASRLELSIPKNAILEIVSEKSTSNVKVKGLRKKISDADAAVNIARKESI